MLNAIHQLTATNLAVPLAISAVTSGLMRVQKAGEFFNLKRGWASSPTVVFSVLTSFKGKLVISRLSDQTGLSKKNALKVAKAFGLKYRNVRPNSIEVKRAVQLILVDNLSFREAAKRSGISRSALHRYVVELRERIACQGSDLQVKRTKEYRCELHGRINVYPCVACAAMKASGRRAIA